MSKKDRLLDGLSWASLTDKARAAKIAAGLVEDLGLYNDSASTTDIIKAVRATSPPHGKSKIICELVGPEVTRQHPIHYKRWVDHRDQKIREEALGQTSVRINNAYAAAFRRPSFERHTPSQPSGYNDNDDRGDDCVALMHCEDYIIALVRYFNGAQLPHIAVTKRNCEPVKTFFRDDQQPLVSFANSALSFGGMRVERAVSRGLRVVTDWVGRKTTIYFPDGPKVLPWLTARYEKDERGRCKDPINTITMGDVVIDEF